MPTENFATKVLEIWPVVSILNEEAMGVLIIDGVLI